MSAYAAELVVDPTTGRFEVRGPVDFVKEMLPEVKILVRNPRMSNTRSDAAQASPADEITVAAAPKKSKKGLALVASAAFDITGKADGGLSLAKFFEEKKPGKSHDALIPFFTYYGTKHAGLKGVGAGHLMYCYEQLGLKKPGNIYAAMNNARQRAKKVVTGPESNTLVPNVAGENWVKFDLPVKVVLKN